MLLFSSRSLLFPDRHFGHVFPFIRCVCNCHPQHPLPLPHSHPFLSLIPQRAHCPGPGQAAAPAARGGGEDGAAPCAGRAGRAADGAPAGVCVCVCVLVLVLVLMDVCPGQGCRWCGAHTCHGRQVCVCVFVCCVFVCGICARCSLHVRCALPVPCSACVMTRAQCWWRCPRSWAPPTCPTCATSSGGGLTQTTAYLTLSLMSVLATPRLTVSMAILDPLSRPHHTPQTSQHPEP